MHRSGTSVVAGVVDRLGLDGGPRSTMLAADRFNSDGYWEQRPVVEWHDRVLASLGGWASAPPPPPGPERARQLAAALDGEANALIDLLYERHWFMKDPRQCLLLWLWSALRGERDLAVAVFRDPAGVVRSLGRRNAYSNALGYALWERYCHDLLRSLDGRPCVVLDYADLTADPGRWVEVLAGALDRHLPATGGPFSSRVGEATALVRRLDRAPAGDVRHLNPSQRQLAELVADLRGYHERFVLNGALPTPSEEGTTVIERRRRRLNRFRFAMGSSSMKARFDRLPSLVRHAVRAH
ncbi:MAG TPA: hypothetical protein VGB14_01965 [Acidimicrobiales bacterium]|jgi:hypothetical protein